MNERIKELWDKVDIQEEGNPPSIVITSERELQEFAELIVKECAEQCTTDGPFGAEVVWGKQFNKKILEHFGVE